MSAFQGIVFRLSELRADLQKEIENNDIPGKDGVRGLSAPTLARIEKLTALCEPMEKALKAAEKLYGHDHGDESFDAIFDEAMKNLADIMAKA